MLEFLISLSTAYSLTRANLVASLRRLLSFSAIAAAETLLTFMFIPSLRLC